IRGNGRRFSRADVEIGGEGVSFRLGDLGEFVARSSEGVSLRLGDLGEFTAGPEGVNLVRGEQEIHLGQGGPRIRSTHESGPRERSEKAARASWVEIALPRALPALHVELRKGDLALADAQGSI